jgi:hypothetical protein
LFERFAVRRNPHISDRAGAQLAHGSRYGAAVRLRTVLGLVVSVLALGRSAALGRALA